MDKVTWRLVPFLIACYFIAYLDRVNARLCQRLDEQRRPKSQRGGFWWRSENLFFIAYFFFEVPSNLALNRFGARLWIARIMFTWGDHIRGTSLCGRRDEL